MENNENQSGQPEHHPAPYEHPQFEVHQQGHEITDLADESPSAAAERAQHAQQIVDILNHSDQNITMQISEQNTEMINDLIEINNDRVEGFEKAGADLDEQDSDLATLFNQLASESRQNASELTRIVQDSGFAPVEGTSTSGALHRAWIDIKSTFTGSDREAILDECERGEDAIKTAYHDALNAETAPGEELLQVLRRQQQGINAGHDRIKALRDMADMTGEDSQEPTEAEGNANAPGYVITAGTADPVSQDYAAQPSFEGAAGEFDRITEPESMEQDTAGGSNKLMEFFVNELKDLLWAEKELIDVLPDMADAATSVELRNAFENHSVETQTHVARLEQVFGILGLEAETRKCDAMAGITDEGDEIISATEEGTAQRDVGLIFAGQKAEHYEIASYGGLIALAKTLGYYDIAELLVLTLDEEKSADALLTEIAESQANYDASRETED
jgi:uncharacterized protein (TIGR02284 family)